MSPLSRLPASQGYLQFILATVIQLFTSDHLWKHGIRQKVTSYLRTFVTVICINMLHQGKREFSTFCTEKLQKQLLLDSNSPIHQQEWHARKQIKQKRFSVDCAPECMYHLWSIRSVRWLREEGSRSGMVIHSMGTRGKLLTHAWSVVCNFRTTQLCILQSPGVTIIFYLIQVLWISWWLKHLPLPIVTEF